MNGQTQRLRELFLNSPNTEIPSPTLHRVGSGKDNGYCSSISRRITDLRMMGLNIVKVKDEYHDGQRQTAYAYQP